MKLKHTWWWHLQIKKLVKKKNKPFDTYSRHDIPVRVVFGSANYSPFDKHETGTRIKFEYCVTTGSYIGPSATSDGDETIKNWRKKAFAKRKAYGDVYIKEGGLWFDQWDALWLAEINLQNETGYMSSDNTLTITLK